MKIFARYKNLLFIFLVNFLFLNCKEEAYQNDKNTSLKNELFPNNRKITEYVKGLIGRLNELLEKFKIVQKGKELSMEKSKLEEKKSEIEKKIFDVSQMLENLLQEQNSKAREIAKREKYISVHKAVPGEINFIARIIIFYMMKHKISEIENKNNPTEKLKQIGEEIDKIEDLINEYLYYFLSINTDKLIYQKLIKIEIDSIIKKLIELNKDKSAAIYPYARRLAENSQIKRKRGQIKDAFLDILKKLENTFGKEVLLLTMQKFKKGNNLGRDNLDRWYDELINSINYSKYGTDFLDFKKEIQKDIKKIETLISEYKELIKKLAFLLIKIEL